MYNINMMSSVKYVVVLLSMLGLSGCSTMGYYWQAMNGHADLLNRQQPIEEVLADKSTRPEVKQKLEQVKVIRQFASDELALPDNDSYTQYVDLERPFAIWNVIATPKYSIKAKQWCFLFVGCINYRGYYDKQEAETYAESLRQQGYDVMVSGARAYSTLGWFDDPLLNTMLYKDDARLAGIIFHELSHQQVYKKDYSAFNEAFAMAVEVEGVLKWLALKDDQAAIKKYNQDFTQQIQFNQLLRNTRDKLKVVYQGKKTDEEKAIAKNKILIALQYDYKILKQKWNGDDGYDKWMAQDLNNAHLALVGTYYDYVPYFRSLLREQEGNFANFYRMVEAMSDDELKSLISE